MKEMKMADPILPNKFYRRKQNYDHIVDELLQIGSKIVTTLYALETVILSSKLIYPEFKNEPSVKKLVNLRDQWVNILTKAQKEGKDE